MFGHEPYVIVKFIFRENSRKVTAKVRYFT